MADPSNDEKFDKGKPKQTISSKGESSSGQSTGGNDSGRGSGTPVSQGAEFGGQAATGETQTSSGSEPPRSMGTRGSEFGQFGDAASPAGQQGQSGTGQADLGTQAGSTLAGRTDQQDLGDVDQPASYGSRIGDQQFNTEGEGFILQRGPGSEGVEQRISASSAKSTDGTDFARDGHGVTEEENQDDKDEES